MSSVGSISEQTLGGVIATATHGSGLHFGVISTSVISLTLLLADGTRQTCSRDEHTDLFLASLCGLGATGLVLSVTLAVEPSFRLKELQKSLNFEEVVTRLDEHVSKAQHVRLWWYPTKDVIRVSYCNRTDEVSFLFLMSLFFFITALAHKPWWPMGLAYFLWASRHSISSFCRQIPSTF